jgi:hypothetical protein
MAFFEEQRSKKKCATHPQWPVHFFSYAPLRSIALLLRVGRQGPPLRSIARRVLRRARNAEGVAFFKYFLFYFIYFFMA